MRAVGEVSVVPAYSAAITGGRYASARGHEVARGRLGRGWSVVRTDVRLTGSAEVAARWISLLRMGVPHGCAD